MTEGTTRLEIIKEISICKVDIKKASKNILANLNNSQTSINIDNEILDILDALGNIGMLANNSSVITNYAVLWYNGIVLALEANEKFRILLLRQSLTQLCMTSFWINKKEKNYKIKLSDINLLKLGL